MSVPDKMGLTPEAAEGYEQYFVPAIFEQWVPVLIEAAGLAEGDSVLDVGCGTGVLSREAIKTVGGSGSVTGIDLSESMLGVARTNAPGVDFRQGDATSLPFDDGSFDVVISSFMLMFVPEPDKAVSEMLRVLRNGGRIVVGVWESLGNNPVYAKLVRIVKNRINVEAGESLSMPYALGEDGRLKEIMKALGIESASVKSCNGRAQFPSLEVFVTTEIRSWVLADSVDDKKLAEVVADAKIELARFHREDGSIDFPFNAIIAKATKY